MSYSSYPCFSSTAAACGVGGWGVGEAPLSNALSEGVLQGSVLDLHLITHMSLGQGHI